MIALPNEIDTKLSSPQKKILLSAKIFFKFSCPLRWAFPSFLASLFACTSTPSGYKRANPPELFNLKSQISSACFLTKTDGQLAAILQGGGLLDMNFEGIWERKFNVFRAQIVSPLGEELGRVEIENNNEQPRFSTLDNSETVVEISSLLALLGELGPSNLRTLTCGFHPFAGNPEVFQSDISKNAVPRLPSTAVYLTRSILKTHSAQARLETHVVLENDKNGMRMTAESIIKSGPFGLSQIARLKWQGHISKQKIYPETLELLAETGAFKLTFSSFD